MVILNRFYNLLGILDGDWGLGIVDLRLVLVYEPQSIFANPISPIPNPNPTSHTTLNIS